MRFAERCDRGQRPMTFSTGGSQRSPHRDARRFDACESREAERTALALGEAEDSGRMARHPGTSPAGPTSLEPDLPATGIRITSEWPVARAQSPGDAFLHLDKREIWLSPSDFLLSSQLPDSRSTPYPAIHFRSSELLGQATKNRNFRRTFLRTPERLAPAAIR